MKDEEKLLKKGRRKISLNRTEIFNISDTTKYGPIFCHIDPRIYQLFYWAVRDSPAVQLTEYKLTAEVFQWEALTMAEKSGVYVALDLAQLWQICKRHIYGKENLLNEDAVNYFFAEDKNGDLNLVSIYFESVG